jgi:hypothetical protein
MPQTTGLAPSRATAATVARHSPSQCALSSARGAGLSRSDTGEPKMLGAGFDHKESPAVQGFRNAPLVAELLDGCDHEGIDEVT